MLQLNSITHPLHDLLIIIDVNYRICLVKSRGQWASPAPNDRKSVKETPSIHGSRIPLHVCVFSNPYSGYRSLSHPGLGWLYVFSSFPPRPPRWQLLPLTSKPFQLNPRYLAHRIYGSGELYWMTFPWPWPKVMAEASITKNLFVCTIKWEPLIRSLQNMATLLTYSWLLPD